MVVDLQFFSSSSLFLTEFFIRCFCYFIPSSPFPVTPFSDTLKSPLSDRITSLPLSGLKFISDCCHRHRITGFREEDGVAREEIKFFHSQFPLSRYVFPYVPLTSSSPSSILAIHCIYIHRHRHLNMYTYIRYTMQNRASVL